MTCGFVLFLLCAAHSGAATFEDYERAREALRRGEILPLVEIVDRVESELGARMIEVEFDAAPPRYLYEIELITQDGRLLEVSVDAATGAILTVQDEEDD